MPDFSNIQNALTLANRSELSGLFASSSAETLGPNIEALVEEHPDDPIIKLLWCFAQGYLQSLPLPFIASSLNELLQDRNKLKTAERLTFLVASFISQNLRESKELRSSILVASEFITNPLDGFFDNLEEWQNTKSELLLTIDEEKAAALKKREPQNYIASLEALKKTLTSSKAPKFSKNKIPLGQTSSLQPEPLDSLKKPIPDFILENNSKIHSEEFVLGNAPNISTSDNLRKEDLKHIQNDTNKSPNYWKTALIIVLVVASVSVAYREFPIDKFSAKFSNLVSSKNPTSTKLIYETRLENSALPSYPTLPPFTLNSMGPSLEDINKRLEKLNSKPDGSTSKAVTEKEIAAPTPAVDNSEVESLNSIPDKTSSPTSQTPVPKLPNLPTNSGNTIDLGSNNKGNQVKGQDPNPGNLRQGTDGRIFGPPQVNDPASGRNQERALDGSPLKSYEVERFDPPLVYETITATNVLAAPSLMSQTITRIKSGTPIHVSAVMGLWVEIKSNEGRVGYIFAQDAVKK